MGIRISLEQITTLHWEGMESCCYSDNKKELHGKYLACMQPHSSCCGPKFLTDEQPQSAEKVTPNLFGAVKLFSWCVSMF